MKISFSNERGGTLVTCLIVIGVLSLSMLAAMNMVSTQRRIVGRTQFWNGAIPLCEAGLEDALAHLNYSGTTNLGSDGWTATLTNYWRSNSMSGGYYYATISTSLPPVITSRGNIFDATKSNYLARTVQITTKLNGQFPNALLARNSINFGTGVEHVDSFNSTNSSFSTGGQYDSTKAEANANVDVVSGTTAAIKVGNSLIDGNVDTGPGGTVTINQGIVGDTAFVNTSGNATKMESGHVLADVNTIIPDVPTPSLSAPTTLSATSSLVILGITFSSTYVLSGGNYITNGNLAMGGGNTAMYVNAPSTLYVTGSFSTANSAEVYIAPGASLTLYVGGPNCSIGGAGIVNNALTASACTIRCLPGCTNVPVNNSGAFTGTIYAPEATVTINGAATVTGAIVGGAIVMGGSGSMHYDEALGGPVGYKYLVTSWQEQ